MGEVCVCHFLQMEFSHENGPSEDYDDLFGGIVNLEQKLVEEGEMEGMMDGLRFTTLLFVIFSKCLAEVVRKDTT